MDFDVIVVGAGPAGLCLARALRDTGLTVCLLEQQSRAALESPAFDGREIALTQRSRQHLQTLDIWPRLGEGNIAPLKDALVMNGRPGPSQARMTISHSLSTLGELGHLVGNHHIRRAAFEAAMCPTDATGMPPELLCDTQVVRVSSDEQQAQVWLSDGRTLCCRLLVAADSRHSSTRRAMGIPAHLHDYGRTMLVCVMTHDKPHGATAWEWFGHGQTLALLPMNPCPETGLPRSSVVLTLPQEVLQPLVDMEPGRFSAAMTQRFDGQLGTMTLVSTRHAYPLVAVWPHRLVAQRFAAVGDAAVGMHPVTAHGFNLGLRSIDTLAQALRAASQRRQDIASLALLRQYERQHQRHSLGLFMATHAIVSLYTREEAPARWLRHAMVNLADRLTPFKRALAGSLTGLG